MGLSKNRVPPCTPKITWSMIIFHQSNGNEVPNFWTCWWEMVGTSEHHQSRPENQKAFASDRCAPWGPFKRSIVQLQIQRLPPQIPPSPYFSKGHSNKNPTDSTEDVKGSLKSVRTNQTSRHARPNRFKRVEAMICDVNQPLPGSKPT